MTDSVTVTDLYEQLSQLEGLRDYPVAVAAAGRRRLVVDDDLGFLEESSLTLAELGQMLITDANGKASLPEQQVEVQYLKTEQRLVIPAGLGMSVIATVKGRCVPNMKLVRRYQALAALSYDELVAIVGGAGSDQDRLRVIEELEAPALTGGKRKVDWPEQTIGENAAQHTIATYTKLSAVCQMNFDIRDMGCLNEEGMYITDSQWDSVNYDTVTQERLMNKLHPYSLMNLAALNVQPCANYAMGAWVRAFGVGCGFLPAPTSKSNVEWTFTTRFPKPEMRDAARAYEKKRSMSMMGISLNLIAMFGLFHLNKDHTFKTGDENMLRISTSWLNTVRTMTTDEWQAEMLGKIEVMVRTAPHPFGLAQTYFVARALHMFDAMASPLAIRINTTPPPVQRIMIAHAAKDSWSAMTVGIIINEIYVEVTGELNKAEKEIRSHPVQYSGLARLYGYKKPVPPPETGMLAANILMPLVYGYADAVFNDETAGKSGMALAQSLGNVKRDNSAVAHMWSTMWNNYMDGAEKMSLVDFAKQTRATFAETGGMPAFIAAKQREAEQLKQDTSATGGASTSGAQK